MIEKDSVDSEHIVGFSVVDGDPIRIQLGGSYANTRQLAQR